MSQSSINDVAIKLLTALDDVNSSVFQNPDYSDDREQLNTDTMMQLGSLLNRARKLAVRNRGHRDEKRTSDQS